MAESFYEPDDGPADLDGHSWWRATAATGGPWSSRLQHGGPPSALLVRAAERAAHRHTGREDLQALRVVVDFLGPVPVDVMEVRAELVRAGRSAVLVDCELSAAGRTALRARTWLVRRPDQPTPAGALTPAGAPTPAGGPTSATATPPATALPPAAPDPDELPDDDRWDFGYAHHLRWRPASGVLHAAGPACVWVSPQVPLVPGERLTGLQRVVTVADSASGVSAELDWRRWSFPNVDLTVHLSRPPDGEWLLMDARTQLEPTGNALAQAVLSDRHGPVGRSAQTLVVGPLQ